MAKRYTKEFKQQVVELFLSGVRQCELMKQFNLPKCTIRTWRKEYKERGGFDVEEKLSPEALELKKVKKELEKLQKELTILKHAALILGTRRC